MTFDTKMTDNHKELHEDSTAGSNSGGGGGGGGDGQSPGHAFGQLFQLMHDMSDKLLSIDYQKEFCRQYKCPPISRYYFCRQTNSGQQFYAFTALSAYLLRRLNPDMAAIDVDAYEDPMVTINAILQAAKEYGVDITGYYNNAVRMRPGFGHECVGLLNDLVVKVLDSDHRLTADRNANQITVKGIGSDDTDDHNIDDELANDEINASDVIEVVDDDAYDYDFNADNRRQIIEDELVDTTTAMDGRVRWEASGGTDTAIMRSDVDLNEWRREVERVLPQLKVRIGGHSSGDHKSTADNEWRTHYQSLSANYSQMRSHTDQMSDSLSTLLRELRQTDEKIAGREKYLRNQLEDTVDELVAVRQKTDRLRADYSVVSSGVVDKSAALAEVSAQIEATKQEMEASGAAMTDSSPLAAAKRAKDVLRQELTAIDLRIGVAVQTLIVNNHASVSVS